MSSIILSSICCDGVRSRRGTGESGPTGLFQTLIEVISSATLDGGPMVGAPVIMMGLSGVGRGWWSGLVLWQNGKMRVEYLLSVRTL